MDSELIMWLLERPRPKLTGAVCRSQRVEHMSGHTITTGARTLNSSGPCRRPVWMEGLCSRCWHAHMMFHGPYQLLKANPAAASLDAEGIARLTFSAMLPNTAANLPDIFPEEWIS